MDKLIEVRVPNLGDFDDVEIIDVLVKKGDSVKLDDPLITLESDKATMDIPSTAAGEITEVKVSVGERVAAETLIMLVAADNGSQQADTDSRQQTAPATIRKIVGQADSQAELVVLGAGPGGYTAAFRAADLGKKVVLIERYPALGGVCLNVGCIPSKALLHAAKVISETKEMREFGIDFGTPEIDRSKLRDWKQSVLEQLTNGLKGLARQRKVEVVQGSAQFASANQLTLETDSGTKSIAFEQAIIAAGSQATRLPDVADDPRIMDSTAALELDEIPARLLVIGGGIIGLEMATIYAELGSRITVVEMLDQLITGADADLVKPLQRRIQKQYENIFLATRVNSITASKQGLDVTFDGPEAPEKDRFDRVLVAVGRRPNGHNIGAEHAGLVVTEQGFITVDQQQRTNIPHIFAIGDIVGEPMLAHKAAHEGKVAAEVAAGLKSHFNAKVIPSVAYTDPEIAWVGVTETLARASDLDYGKGVFPWAASGRSLSLGRNEGMTKLLFDKQTKQIIGAGIVGPNAGDLIAEAALAIEMGCDAEDIGLTIHPHPTLSETLAFSAEVFAGTITDLYIPKKK